MSASCGGDTVFEERRLLRRVLRNQHNGSRDGGVDVLVLSAELRRAIRDGEVRFDLGTRAAYAHDSSNFRQVPLGVVLPKNEDELISAVELCRKHGAPVLMRGCGTSLSGETVNTAIIIDVSKYMREILEVNPDKRFARVEPGVVRDQLSDMTQRQYGLFFAPDTSTHAYATLGGMIGNNSCGVHSVMAGRTSDNVEELKVMLYDGTRIEVGPTSEEELEQIIAEGGRKGEIYSKLKELRDRYADLIRQRYPDIPRRAAGYNLDELLPEKGFSVARALVGSEGTLVTVLAATVRLVHSPPHRSLLVC
jgi:FAD/FMN-containing dehydrogenase